MIPLVHIETITKVLSIMYADRLEYAKVLEHYVIVPKGIFKPGDQCIYCESNSVMPALSMFNFLKRYNYHVKNRKIRGRISQGLVLGLDALELSNPGRVRIIKNPSGRYQISIIDIDSGKITINIDIKNGLDVTGLIGAKKYKKHIKHNNLPDKLDIFKIQMDEEKIQSCYGIIKDYKSRLWYVLEKLKGATAIYYFHKGNFGIISVKGEIKKTSKNLFWQIAEQYDLENKFRTYSTKHNNIEFMLQGEIIGPGIYNNYYQLSERVLYFSALYYINGNLNITGRLKELIDITNELDIDMIPIKELHRSIVTYNIESLRNEAKTQSLINKRVVSYGSLYRLLAHEDIPRFGRVAFKVLSE